MKRKTLLTTRDIAYSAVLAALSIVTNSFALDTGSHSVTFTYSVCFFAGHFFGPLVGGTVGLVGDIVGCFVKGYAPNPLILVGSVLVGVLPGIVQLLSKKIPVKKEWYAPVWTIVSFVVTFVLVTVFWNTFALWFSYSRATKTYWAYMAGRLALQSIVWGVNLGFCLVAYPVLSRVLHLSPTTIVERIRQQPPTATEPKAKRSARQILVQDHLSPVITVCIVTGTLLVAVAVGLAICLP